MKNFLEYLREGIDDPYNEETDDKEDNNLYDGNNNVYINPSERQKNYLNDVLKKIKQLKDIQDDLVELCKRDQDNQIEIGDFLDDYYPFITDLDNYPLNDWYSEFYEKVDQINRA